MAATKYILKLGPDRPNSYFQIDLCDVILTLWQSNSDRRTKIDDGPKVCLDWSNIESQILFRTVNWFHRIEETSTLYNICMTAYLVCIEELPRSTIVRTNIARYQRRAWRNLRYIWTVCWHHARLRPLRPCARLPECKIRYRWPVLHISLSSKKIMISH